MGLAFWITLGAVAALHAGLLRLTVPVVAKKADNGWDNAFAYVVVTGLMAYFPMRWMFESDSVLLTFFALPLCWVAQTVTLKTLYETTLVRAWLLGVFHTVVSACVTTALTLIAGVIAAYIMYGKIISDPMRLVRLLLQLIGIELPVD